MDRAPTPKFQLSLLGRFELTGPDGPVDLTSKKLAGLLAFLACTAPEPQGRDRLMTLLWGSHFEAQARQNLRQAFTRLRRVLGEGALIANGETVSLRSNTIASDVARFETLLRDGGRDALDAAVGLYRDSLLADIVIPEEGWSGWLNIHRQRFEGLALDAMVKLGEQELQLGHQEPALKVANRAIAISNLREDAHRLAIRALVASGRRADALKHYEQLAVLLKRELAVEPDAATASLAAELRKSHTAKPRPEAKSDAADELNVASRTNGMAPPFPDRDVPAGERKHVTALYADLKDSLELIAQRDPEEALRILEAVLKLMMQAVHRYEGTVNLITADGIMALFGVPLAHEDHAVRACYAALQLQGAVKRYAQERERLLGVPILVRAGLNSGEVVIRPIANDQRMEYRAMGQTTHLAARLGQIAAPGTLLVSVETLRLAEGHIHVKALQPANIGSRGEVAYELVGASEAQTRFRALAARGLTGFVGRSAEIEQLERVRARVQRGHGQVVAIIGEPGLGKSRLVYEFIHSHRLQGWLALESACVSYSRAASYQPVVDMLRNHFGIEVSDDVRAMQNKVDSRLPNVDQVFAHDLPAFMALLDIPVEEPSWLALDAMQRRQQTLDALKRLILRQCQQQPVILVCEDLHWIDGETEAFLETLIDGLVSAPLLLILTYRPEYEHHWGGKSYYTQLRLDALSPEVTEQFLSNLVGDDASLMSFKTLLPPDQGTPFFLEETVRALVETSLLEGKRGNYRLVRPLEEVRTPASVQAILAARMDRLPARQKWLLQAASVIGEDVPHAILQLIAGLEEDELRRRLAKLREAEFLYQARLFPDLEYAFKHALTHEVAYGSLLAEERRALHRKIVDAVERLYPDRLAEQIERVAHHAIQAEMWEKAVDYARQAGNKAVARWALLDARTWFEHALVALQRLPETQFTLELGFAILFELRPVLIQLGEAQQGLERLREAEILAKKLNDDRRRGQVYAYMTNAHLLCGVPNEALLTGTRALEIAKRLGDLELRLVTTTYLEHCHHHRAEYGRVVELATENLAALPAEWTYESFGGTAPLAIFDRFFLIASLAELGRFTEAAEYQAEVILLADPTDHAHAITIAYDAGGILHLLWGDWARARSLVETGIIAAKKRNLAGQLRILVPSSAWALAQLGETGAALNRVHEGQRLLERQASRGFFGRLGWGYYLLGCACLQLERLDEASRFGDLAVKSSPHHPGFRAHGLQLLADIAAHDHRFNLKASEALYRGALALGEPRRMRPLIAHCHRGLAKLYDRIGERQKAQEHLTTAMAMYRDMDMRFWLMED
jgi:class 3 adenylate cyclase